MSAYAWDHQSRLVQQASANGRATLRIFAESCFYVLESIGKLSPVVGDNRYLLRVVDFVGDIKPQPLLKVVKQHFPENPVQFRRRQL